MRILVVDDDRVNRQIISHHLTASGYEVVACADGEAAWEIIGSEEISLVVTDWIMPRMDGIELCHKIRQTHFDRYIYTIIVTSKDEQQDLIHGMDAGADDFLVKPVNREVLGACIRAGERILALERRLEERNRKLKESRDRLQHAYSIMQKDLEAAARVQKSLIPRKSTVHPGVRFHWMFQPCAHVAGDIFNCFSMDENHLGFYLLDVSGHGIPAAMLSVMIGKLLVPDTAQDNLLKRSLPDPPYYQLVPPEDVVRDLNDRFQSHETFSRYFTMIYGIINRTTGAVRLCQAGHPHPVLVQGSGQARSVGQSGFPVGILPNLDYSSYAVQLAPGDRLILYSDGITGCMNARQEEFSQDRLIRLLVKTRQESLVTTVQTLSRQLRQWNGPRVFGDDMTLLAIEYTGASIFFADAEEPPLIHRVIEIEGTLDQAVMVRRFVDAFCKQVRFAEKTDQAAWSMELAVHETVTNIIRHAIGDGGSHMIRIDGLAFSDRTEFLITYDGRAFDPDRVPEPLLDGSQTAHFGLYLVNRCVDVIDYRTKRPGEKCIRLVKNHSAQS
ncbi:MprA: response regulator receiver protein [Desulfosarcina variabilis str. Montpellier]|uniref:ATP-binding SpoIIE family protein phosphatase n=1 Tax=Desulfosarcina variabilis TaxID=2300 RepID=UPI003AFB2C4B